MPLAQLSAESAFAVGAALGDFFRVMHQQPAPLAGHGELYWKAGGLVDSVPLLDSGTYYAAWFLHCYRLFLPAISLAPRYRHNHFHRHAEKLAAIADGFESVYTQQNIERKQALNRDEFLWALDLAHESGLLLRDGINEKMRLRRGDEANITATLKSSLQRLSNSD